MGSLFYFMVGLAVGMTVQRIATALLSNERQHK